MMKVSYANIAQPGYRVAKEATQTQPMHVLGMQLHSLLQAHELDEMLKRKLSKPDFKRDVRKHIKPLVPPTLPDSRHALYHGAVDPLNQLNVPVFCTRVTTFGDVKSPHPSKEQIAKERLACHYCQLDNFTTAREYPVTITNTVDDEYLPQGFKFIPSSILREGVEAADHAFHTGCDCSDDLDCERQGCQCMQDVAPRNGRGKKSTLLSAYDNWQYTDKVVLREDMLDSREPIYECHDECSCSRDCINRVVERGRKIPLEIFRTDDGRGWGVRSSVTIEEGQFVDKYVGEVITGEEASIRREASDLAQRKDVYLFALDKFSNVDSIDPRLAGQPYEVDGEFMAGPTRFINHSCSPNLRIFAKVGDQADKHIHELAFFAIQRIPAGEELTFDYVDGNDDDDLYEEYENMKEKMTVCLCGSEDCRGFVW